jgi:aryl-alcohol dehydrogenase-like predicted oxidoreductase
MSGLESRRVGTSDLCVSELCLGTVTFGDVTDQSDAASILDRYLEHGGNFIDTADVYADGRSEQIVGALLKGRRDRVILGTKGGMQNAARAQPGGCSRKNLIAAVNASLQRLRTDWIDLYQLHVPDPQTPIAETLATLDELVRSGKIRYFGASNFAGWQLAKALYCSTSRNLGRFVSLQAQYSVLCRDIELDLMPLCSEEALPVIAWAPLGGGVLSGKYDTSRPPDPGTRLAETPNMAHPLTSHAQSLVEELRRIAAETGRTPARVALRWITSQPLVVSAIVGARTAAQLLDNLAIGGWRLDEDHTRRLAKLSRPRLPYPHDLQRMLGCLPVTQLDPTQVPV